MRRRRGHLGLDRSGTGWAINKVGERCCLFAAIDHESMIVIKPSMDTSSNPSRQTSLVPAGVSRSTCAYTGHCQKCQHRVAVPLPSPSSVAHIRPLYVSGGKSSSHRNCFSCRCEARVGQCCWCKLSFQSRAELARTVLDWSSDHLGPLSSA